MNDNMKKIISLLILVAAVVLVVYGVMTGGFREVWAKAAMVCLECIGIG